VTRWPWWRRHERAALGTTVLVLPHRHPLLAAKMLATLDHLAPGRVILGAGVGWMREEIEALGAPYDRRGAWSDEAIRVMRACWRDERGRPHRRVLPLRRARLPARAGRAGASPSDRRPHPARAAPGGRAGRRLARGVPHGGRAEGRDRAPAHGVRKAGRDPKTLTLSARLGLPGKKPSAELLSEVRALADLGVDHVILEPAARDLASMTAAIERFAADDRAKL